MMWHLAAIQLWREKNNPEFRILGVALFLSVFAVTLLSCFSYSLKAFTFQDAAQMLGADLVLESSEPLESKYKQYADQQAIASVSMTEFFSMISFGEKTQLANIAAFDGHFPLRGKLTVLQDKNKIEPPLAIPQFAPPKAGEIWLEESLSIKLNARLYEQVEIGNAKFLINGFLQQRPIAITQTSVLAPVVYVNAKDLDKMGTLRPGSRATYRLLLAGTSEQLSKFKQHFNQVSSTVQWVSPQTGRRSVSNTLSTVNRYLTVILLIQVALAATAIGLCAHQYSIRQQRTVAIWRCLGITANALLKLQMMSLGLFSLLVLFFAIATGYGIAVWLLRYGHYLGVYELTLGWQAGFLGMMTGTVMLMGFALPPIMQLRKIAPMQILQRQATFVPGISVTSSVFALLALTILFITFLGESAIAIRLGIQMVIIAFIALSIAWGLWYGLTFLANGFARSPLAWRFGISYMVRHKLQGIVQWCVFTLVIMLLLLVQIIGKDFLKAWQAQLPTTTPNYFLINIQDNQVLALKQWFAHHHIQEVQFYPVVRARMSQVNGVAAGIHALERPLNLTWMSELPPDNREIAGQSWSKVHSSEALISVESGFAERQGLKLNDTLSFQIAEQQVTGKIVQLRTVDWETFKPNFFVIFAPGVIDHFPHFYMTSFYLPSTQQSLIKELSEQFVEISIIDIDALLQTVKNSIEKISYALNGLLGMVFVFGILILYANLLSTLKERLQESAMLQVIGAKRIFVLKVLLVEFGVLGFLSGLFASVLAMLLAYDLSQHVFNVHYSLNFKWILLGPLLSTSIIVFFGLIGARSVFRVSPLWILRERISAG